jgi:LacI family transcriptional regulator
LASPRRVKLVDLAVAAGLSQTQVSRALAGYPDVSEPTRERVRLLAKQLGYRPSLRARSLAAGREATLRIAVVTLNLDPQNINESSYAPALPGIMAQASEEGIDVHLVALNGSAPPEVRLAQLAAEDRGDGAILLTFAALQPRHVAPLIDARLPFVLVNRHFGHIADAPPAACVTLDWAGSTADAITRLHTLGHRRIAGLFNARPTSTLADHERGWQNGLRRIGLSAENAPIVTYELPDERAGYERGGALLDAAVPGVPFKPTAIVAFNDGTAFGCLRAARERGVHVPEGLSIVGFDDNIGRYTHPALCSYDPHYFEAGVRAAALLGRILRGEERGTPREIVPYTFHCRATCGPAPR